MRRADLGFYKNESGTLLHGHQLTGLESKCIACLQASKSVGEQFIPADELAAALELGGRDLRNTINHLVKRHGLPVIHRAGAGGGYRLSSDAQEIAVALRAQMRRVSTGLQKARAYGASAAQMSQGVVQLCLGLPDDERQAIVDELADSLAAAGAPGAGAATVQQAVKILADNPQDYQAEIDALAAQLKGRLFTRADIEKVLAESHRITRTRTLNELFGAA